MVNRLQPTTSKIYYPHDIVRFPMKNIYIISPTTTNKYASPRHFKTETCEFIMLHIKELQEQTLERKPDIINSDIRGHVNLPMR